MEVERDFAGGIFFFQKEELQNLYRPVVQALLKEPDFLGQFLVTERDAVGLVPNRQLLEQKVVAFQKGKGMEFEAPGALREAHRAFQLDQVVAGRAGEAEKLSFQNVLNESGLRREVHLVFDVDRKNLFTKTLDFSLVQ